MAIFDDLEAEQDRLEEILTGLDGAQWLAPSAAAGWSVADVVLHLAQTEEAVVASVDGAALRPERESGVTVDQLADDMVRAQRADPAVV
ncbi:MAG TPA: maleylpyruvate isomerase N-terminal domain-containing protein, partial [Streptosporangiaceae bacterium]